jgi:hypothetical protein
MVARWRRLRERGWQTGLAINLAGAIATGVVAVVVGVTKFTHGAWIVLLFVPAMVAVLVRINRHYAYVEERLGQRPNPPTEQRRRLAMIVFVAQLDESLQRAMRYVAGVDADDVHAVHIGKPKSSLALAFEARYAIPLVFEPKQGGLAATARRFVRGLRAQHPDRFVAAIVPELIQTPGWVHMARHNHAFRLKAGLLLEAGVSVINVPTIPAEDTLLQRPARRHVVLVPVASLHTGTIEALKFAQLLQPFDIRAVHFQDEEEETERLLRQWEEMGLEIPVEVVAAPYRDIDQPLVHHVRELRADGADLVTVVIGELVLRWWQNLLHNHRALEIKAALLFEPGVAVASVPHRL